MEDILRELQRTSDPAYLYTVSMNELYQNVYQGRPPIIDGLLYFPEGTIMGLAQR